MFLWILAPLPLIAVFGCGLLFPMKKEHKKKYQPPGYVFSIVWTVITLLLGISTALVWQYSPGIPVLPVVLCALLTVTWCLWIALYGRIPKVGSLVVLVISCILAGAHACSVSMAKAGWTQHMCWPLLLSVAWLTFAASLSLECPVPKLLNDTTVLTSAAQEDAAAMEDTAAVGDAAATEL